MEEGNENTVTLSEQEKGFIYMDEGNENTKQQLKTRNLGTSDGVLISCTEWK